MDVRAPMTFRLRVWFLTPAFAATLLLGLGPARTDAQAPAVLADAWDPAAAAEYMDGRQVWWLGWPVAQRDRETVCQSCHTTVPYLLARPVLRAALGESRATIPERELLSHVRKRVTLWNEVAPVYPDQTFGLPKSSESRGVEAVLNAFVLANRDAREDRLSAEARQAFENLWELQFSRGELEGAWAWLYFDLAPWESEGAGYFGAALAAVAVGVAPDDYSASPAIQENLELLREHLLEDWEARPAFDRVMLLWAASALQGLLMPEQGLAVVQDLQGLQNDDGGWSLASLGRWEGRDGYEPGHASDGYATGLIAFVLQEAGMARSQESLDRALVWLAENQDASGRWPASSLNLARDPESDLGLMMADVATAFAVMALTKAEQAGR